MIAGDHRRTAAPVYDELIRSEHQIMEELVLKTCSLDQTRTPFALGNLEQGDVLDPLSISRRDNRCRPFKIE